MTHERRNRLSGGTETVLENSAGKLNDPSLSDTAVIREDPRPAYPDKIRISEAAEHYIGDLAQDLVLGLASLHQLTPALLQFWEFAYWQGRASRDDEIAQLEHDADRLYFEACIRQPQPRGEYTSWADLQQRRKALEEAAAGHYPGGDLRAAWGLDHE